VCAVYHKKERQLWVANLGDSRCVLARQEHGGRVKGEALSLDHKPWDEEERKRIELAGCRVTQGRINGIAFSFSFADALSHQHVAAR